MDDVLLVEDMLVQPLMKKDTKEEYIENLNRNWIIMSRTRRNDMGKKVVRDGKTYRAMFERLDPWDKRYYNAKGMKKVRYKEMQWELRHSVCCTILFDVTDYIAIDPPHSINPPEIVWDIGNFKNSVDIIIT